MVTNLLQEKFTNNINNLFGVNIPDKIAVAVSGGSDSIALLYLTCTWANLNKIDVTIFSVDHNLRAESKSEIAYIKQLSNKLGVNFVDLSWIHDDNTSGVQERAREARYNLITNHCKKLGISSLLTAHHLDDMLETYIIKKSKKTSDLALKPNITYFWENIWILRPLFNIEKKELVDYLLENNINWFEDASNNSDKYERNRVRKNIQKLSTLEKSELLANYYLAINKAEGLDDLLIKSFAEVISIYNEGFAKIDINKFNILDEEIKIHLMNYVLTIISGKSIIPRYRNITKIIFSISNNFFKSSTLSHCHLVNKNGNIIIYKEKSFVIANRHCEESEGRRGNPVADGHAHKWARHDVRHSLACNNGKYLWDNRFEIILNDKNLLKGCYVSNLTLNDYMSLKNFFNLEKLAKDSDNNHKSILFTLPVIKNLEKVVAIPHITYYNTNLLNMGVKVVFRPNFISRFTHFF